jgi:hypothetical protein
MGNLNGHEPPHLDVYLYVPGGGGHAAAAGGDLRPLHVACLRASVWKIPEPAMRRCERLLYDAVAAAPTGLAHAGDRRVDALDVLTRLWGHFQEAFRRAEGGDTRRLRLPLFRGMRGGGEVCVLLAAKARNDECAACPPPDRLTAADFPAVVTERLFFPAMEIDTSGGRSDGYTVGRLLRPADRPGHPGYVAFEKYVADGDAVGVSRSTLEVMRDAAASDDRPGHIVRILDFVERGVEWFIYAAWYPAGRLPPVQDPDAYPLTAAERAQVLRDAWAGLRHLNRALGYIHNDIKAPNILLERRADGLRGVVGDVDDLITLRECRRDLRDPDGDVPIGTEFCGAPFGPARAAATAARRALAALPPGARPGGAARAHGRDAVEPVVVRVRLAARGRRIVRLGRAGHGRGGVPLKVARARRGRAGARPLVDPRAVRGVRGAAVDAPHLAAIRRLVAELPGGPLSRRAQPVEPHARRGLGLRRRTCAHQRRAAARCGAAGRGAAIGLRAPGASADGGAAETPALRPVIAHRPCFFFPLLSGAASLPSLCVSTCITHAVVRERYGRNRRLPAGDDPSQ